MSARDSGRRFGGLLSSCRSPEEERQALLLGQANSAEEEADSGAPISETDGQARPEDGGACSAPSTACTSQEAQENAKETAALLPASAQSTTSSSHTTTTANNNNNNNNSNNNDNSNGSKSSSHAIDTTTTTATTTTSNGRSSIIDNKSSSSSSSSSSNSNSNNKNDNSGSSSNHSSGSKTVVDAEGGAGAEEGQRDAALARGKAEGPPVSPPAEEKGVALCRICLEEDSLPSLEAPCSCTGSQRYAHHECIQRWVREKGHLRCEICGQQYTVQYDVPPQPPPAARRPGRRELAATVAAQLRGTEEAMARELWLRLCFHCAGMLIVGMLLLVGTFRGPPPIERGGAPGPDPSYDPSTGPYNDPMNNQRHHHTARGKDWYYYYYYYGDVYYGEDPDDPSSRYRPHSNTASTLAVFLTLMVCFLMWALFVIAMRRIRMMQIGARQQANRVVSIQMRTRAASPRGPEAV